MSIVPTPTTPTRTPSEENDSNMVHMSKTVSRPRTSRLRSAVWNDFDRIKKNDKDFAVCKLCKKEFIGGTASGTSHLRKHLERCPSRLGDGSQPLLLTGRKRRERSVTITNAKFIQEQSRLDLAHMIILHGYPFSIVEHSGFRMFVNNLQPSFNMVSLETVKADCLLIYEKEKEQIKDILANLSGRISFTTEIWTSCENVVYLCLVGHYIDHEWMLQRKVINYVMVGSPHTGEALSEIIVSCLMEWNIPHKVFGITLEYSPENENLVSRIRDALQKKMFTNEERPFHVRCFAHVLNMVVQDGLAAVDEVINKIRETIKYIKSSQPREQKFNEAVHQARVHSERGLCLDIPTQWSSTHLMIEGALEYKDALSRMQKLDSSYTFAPTLREWEMATSIAVILKPFVEITNDLSGTKFQTSNLYFPSVCAIKFQLNEWCSSGDTFVRSVALKMKESFDSYWATCSLILAVAVILDPRFKMKLVEYYYPQIYGGNAAEQIKDTHDWMVSLYNEYAANTHPALPFQEYDGKVDVDIKHESKGALSMNVSSHPTDVWKGFDEYLSKTTQNHCSKSELDMYLEEAVFPRNVEFNILNWWKVNTPKYPVLSRMARDVLAIPVSTVALDSTFNSGSKLLDSYRSALDLHTLQALMCAQDWLQGKLDDPTLSRSYSGSTVTAVDHV